MLVTSVTLCVYCLLEAYDAEIMIIGNKCDLSDSRIIGEETGRSLAEKYGIRFMETSAKANINVEEVNYLISSLSIYDST